MKFGIPYAVFVESDVVAAAGAEVRAEQGRVHALPQGPPHPEAHPGLLRRLREGGEHGRMAQGEIFNY